MNSRSNIAGLSMMLAAVAAPALVLSARADAKPRPAASPAVRALLVPVLGSDVHGTVRFVSDGRGTTATLTVRGLDPHATAHARLHSGTRLARLSASAARLPMLRADAHGAAHAIGRVRFQDREDIKFATVADGWHTVVLVSGDRIVAYAVIPRP
jgi:hypothetical protein